MSLLHEGRLMRMILAFSAACLLAGPAMSQPASGDAPPAEAGPGGPPDYGDWTVRLGALVLAKPEYPGADDYEFRPLPLIDVDYRDRLFLNFPQGLGGWVYRGESLRFGLAANYRFGRDENDSDNLEGLGDVDGGMTANAFVKWELGDWELESKVSKQVMSANTGYEVGVEAGYTFRPNRKLFLKPSAGVTWVDGEYMGSFFGVNAEQSANSGLPEYDPDAGIQSVDAGILAIYLMNKRWSVQSFVNYSRLVGDAEDSPIVEEENQFTAAVGIAYTF